MRIIDGIAYADDPAAMITVTSVQPTPDHRLFLRFNTGESRVFDFAPLLSRPAFQPLSDPKVFMRAYVDYGTVVWNDGDIDIDPEWLYEDSCVRETTAS